MYEHDDPRSGAIACERPATADRLEIATWLVEPLAPVGVEDAAGAEID